MNLQDITLFKAYIGGNALRDIFIRYYRSNLKDTKNPQSIEIYLANVSPSEVIKNAIKVFKIDSNFGFDFWEKTNDKWRDYFKKIKGKHQFSNVEEMEKVAYNLDGYFSRLRENWDTPTPWKYESVEETRKRCGLSHLDPEKTEEPAEPLIEFTDSNPLDGFEFIDPVQLSGKMKENQVSINTRTGCKKLTFNAKSSSVIVEKGFRFMRLAKKGADIYLVFNHDEGAAFSFPNSDNCRNLVVNSKDVTLKIKALLNISTDYSILFISETLLTDDYLIYKLSKSK